MTSSAGSPGTSFGLFSLRFDLLFSAVCLDSAVARPEFSVRDAAVEEPSSLSCQRELHAKMSSQHIVLGFEDEQKWTALVHDAALFSPSSSADLSTPFLVVLIELIEFQDQLPVADGSFRGI